MPLIALAAGTVLLGGLGAYAISAFSPGINQAETTVANGVSQTTVIIGLSVAAVIVYWGYREFTK